MKNSFSRYFVIALSATAGMAFAGSNPMISTESNQKNLQCHAPGLWKDSSDMNCHERKEGTGQSTVKTVDFRTNGESFAHSHMANAGGKKVSVAKLEVEVPVVKVELFGTEYSVGGAQVCIPVRSGLDLNWREKLGGDGAPCRAQWLSDEGVIVISEKAYSLAQKPSDSGVSWKAGYYGWDMDFWKTLRHEAIHALVDMKYKNEFENENGERVDEVDDWYHFMSEMLAYVGGTGMSVKEAAEHISTHDYGGASVIAKKFLNGEPYTPPEACKKDHGDTSKPVSVEDLKNMDLDDENGDWCKCESPGCIQRESEEGYYVAFQCMICRKINVKFAKKAIELEAKFRARGIKTSWLGPNAEEKARSAAGKTN